MAAVAVAGAAFAHAIDLRITVTNMAPTDGTFLTPTWVGFHDGSFDMFNVGEAASAGLESIAEDGSPAALDGEFSGSGAGTVSTVLSGVGPIAPGVSTSMIVTVDEMASTSRFLSFASMVIPSNDAFIANDNAMAHRIFNEAGEFIGADFVVLGTRVLDAGTEVNDEIPENTAFLGQMAPNTGTPEGGLVHFHEGFMPGGEILTAFPGADFTADGYKVARLQVEVVPEPATMTMLGLGAVAFLRRRKKRA